MTMPTSRTKQLGEERLDKYDEYKQAIGHPNGGNGC